MTIHVFSVLDILVWILRYMCTLCMIETCKFCLLKQGTTLPTIQTPTPVKRNETLELRILQLENKLDDYERRLEALELIASQTLSNLSDTDKGK